MTLTDHTSDGFSITGTAQSILDEYGVENRANDMSSVAELCDRLRSVGADEADVEAFEEACVYAEVKS